MLLMMSAAPKILNSRWPSRKTDRARFIFAGIRFEAVEISAVDNLKPPSQAVVVNEGLQPKPTKDHSLMRWIIIYGVMLLVAFLFGSVPVFISYRKIMDT
jgi:hypothetical protein